MRTSLAVWLALLAPACSGNTPLSVADRFIGRYYLEVDHERALELATGAAAQRLDRELPLVLAARRQAGEQLANRPKVYFERIGEPSPEKDGFRILYKLTSKVPGGPPLERHVSVIVRKVGEKWRVASFVEAG
jgi:hypothetical protein